jgi:hypothetical protein
MVIATKPEQQTGEISYRTTVREMPSEERPREQLERYGAGTLTNAELLAICCASARQRRLCWSWRHGCCASMVAWAG